MNNPPSSENSEVLDGKPLAILSYLSILCIIPLVFKRENSFALHHAKQGLIIFVGQVAIFIIQIILGEWFLKLGMFVSGVLSFLGIISVLKGQYVKLPVIAEIAEKITL